MPAKDVQFGTFQLMPVAPWSTEGETIRNEFNQMRDAEEMGFDIVWLAEHSGSDYGIMGNAAILLAGLATCTKSIRLGTAVCVLPTHDPIRVAEEYAFVDHLSGGRVEFGIGRGYQPGEFTRYGLNVVENRARFQEGLEILLGAWTSEGPFEYDGVYFQIAPTHIRPRPVQKPHPPLWIATGSIETMEWAGRNLIPVMAAPMLPHPVLKGRIESYVEAGVAYGHAEEEVRSVASSFQLLKQIFVTDSDSEAREVCERSYLWYFNELNSRRMFDAPADPQPFEFYLNNTGFLWGTPDRVIDQLHQTIEETGTSSIICWFEHGGMDPKAVHRSMGLFSEKVMPHFKRGAS